MAQELDISVSRALPPPPNNKNLGYSRCDVLTSPAWLVRQPIHTLLAVASQWLFSQADDRGNISEYSVYDVLTSLAWLVRQPIQTPLAVASHWLFSQSYCMVRPPFTTPT
eukprot:1530809-Amphidinium_carterae.1